LNYGLGRRELISPQKTQESLAQGNPEYVLSVGAGSPESHLRKLTIIKLQKISYLQSGISCVAAEVVTQLIINLLALADVMV